SFDAWLIFIDAAKRALAKAKPGTPEFRGALRQAIYSTSEVVGTHGIYNYRPESHVGTDRRALVLVKLEDGQWKLLKSSVPLKGANPVVMCGCHGDVGAAHWPVPSAPV